MSFRRRLQHLLSFVSYVILMPKYVVITALLTYFIQYKKLAWGRRNYVEKNSSFMFR